jgi:uncharacterized protein (DUF1778 family)
MKQPEKRVRVNYRLPADLVKWVKQAAKKKSTTSTGVVVLALTNAKEAKNGS